MHLATWDSLQLTAPYTTPGPEIPETLPLTHLVLPLMPFQVQMLTSLRRSPKNVLHLFYLFGHNSPVLAFSVNRSFINKEVVFVI